MAEKKAPVSNQTAEKLLYVLEELSVEEQPVKLMDLAHRIGMNASTCYRFLTALQNSGYVDQDPETGKYYLNMKICRLAERVRSRIRDSGSAVAILHGFVVQACELFDESAHLVQRQDDHIVYIDNVNISSLALSIHQYIGKTAPMHCTGAGKLFFLDDPEGDLDRYITEHGLKRYTEHTFTTKATIYTELRQIQKQGYALDNEECELGVRCVAVPIRDYTGRITAGLSVSGPVSRLTDEVILARMDRLKRIASEASRALGFSG